MSIFIVANFLRNDTIELIIKVFINEVQNAGICFSAACFDLLESICS